MSFKLFIKDLQLNCFHKEAKTEIVTNDYFFLFSHSFPRFLSRCSIFRIMSSFRNSILFQKSPLIKIGENENIGATAGCTWPRAETFNGLKKVLQKRYFPGPKTQ